MSMMKSQILRYVNSSKAQKSEYHENKTITFFVWINSFIIYNRGGSTTAATSKMECFVIIVNGFQPLTTITKCSILDVAAVLDSPLFKVLQYDDKLGSDDKLFKTSYLEFIYLLEFIKVGL